MKLIQLLGRYLTYRAQGTVIEALTPIGPYIRSLSIGIALVLLSLLGFGLALLFFAGSLFFFIAGNQSFALAALYTALAGSCLGGILAFSGTSFLQRKILSK